jgi:hypothetical protein
MNKLLDAKEGLKYIDSVQAGFYKIDKREEETLLVYVCENEADINSTKAFKILPEGLEESFLKCMNDFRLLVPSVEDSVVQPKTLSLPPISSHVVPTKEGHHPHTYYFCD